MHLPKLCSTFTTIFKSSARYRNYCSTISPPRRMSSIVWIDMEMTGLNVKRDKIMEVVCVITDNELNVLAKGPQIIVHQPDSLLDEMDDWCKTTHAKTGLLELCKKSTITVEQAETQLMSFLHSNHIKARACPLAGNSVYMDRIFLKEYMPLVDEYLHYRIIDVSTCKELCKRWNSRIFSKAPEKRLLHRGYEDIMESISELKYYKQFMFT